MHNLQNGSELLKQILTRRVEIDGHTLSYDSENELIWITNPYGIDSGILYPTEDSCQKFLNRILEGEIYGLSPE